MQWSIQVIQHSLKYIEKKSVTTTRIFFQCTKSLFTIQIYILCLNSIDILKEFESKLKIVLEKEEDFEKRLKMMDQKVNDFMERKKKEEEKLLEDEYIDLLPLNEDGLEVFEKKLKKLEFRELVVRKIYFFICVYNYV